MARAEFVARLAEDVNEILGRFEIHRHGFQNIRHDAHRRDQQRSRNRVLLAGFVRVLVVQTVLTRNERRAVSNGCVVTTSGRLEQAAQTIRQAWIAPAEIVENRNFVRVRADRHGIAHRLVNRGPGHRVRFRTELRADAVRDCNCSR